VLAVLAIIAILMAVLLPAFQRAREQGKRAVCLSNTKTLALAWMMYAEENNGKLLKRKGPERQRLRWGTKTLRRSKRPVGASWATFRKTRFPRSTIDAIDQIRNVFVRRLGPVDDSRRESRPEGFEPPTDGLEIRCGEDPSLGKLSSYDTRQAELTPQLTPENQKQGQIEPTPLPPDLAQIIAAWPNLPEHIKAAIKALMGTQNGDK
jgi:hypothetical protein